MLVVAILTLSLSLMSRRFVLMSAWGRLLARALFHLETGGLHHLCPLIGVLNDEFRELCLRAYKLIGSEIGETRLDRRVGERGVGFLVESLKDFRGRARWRADSHPPDPPDHVEAWKRFTDRRHIGQSGPTLRAGYGKRLEFAGLHHR